MLNLKYTKSKGFVFSLDAAVAAVILLIASSLIINSFTVPQNDSFSSKELIDSAFDSMLKNGYLMQTIDLNSPSQATELIRNKILSFIPENFDARIELKQYDLNSDACRSDKSFESCFPANELIETSAGLGIPADKEVFSSRKTYLKYQPPADCNLEYYEDAELKELPKKFNYLFFDAPQKKTIFTQSNPESILFFDFNEDEFIVDFNVTVNPTDVIFCDQNIDVNVSLSIPESFRKAVDVMIVMDVSGSMSWGGRVETNDATKIVKSGNNVFIADGSYGLKSIDVSNPLLPSVLDTEDSGTYIDVSFSGSTAFVADTSSTDELISVDFTNPSNLNRLDRESVNYITGVYASGDYVFVAGRRTSNNSTRGIIIYDASNPSSLSYVSVATSSDPEDIFVSGDYAFLADGTSGLRVYDISNKSSPSETDSLDFSADSTEAKAVFVSGNTAFVAAENAGLYAIDVTDKNNISILDSYNTPDYALDVFVSGDYAFVSDDSSLQIIDVSNPSDLQLVKSIPTPYYFNSVWIENQYAFLAADNYGLITFDWIQGPRIDNAKAAASRFLDSNNWDFNSDQMGLVSFNTSAVLEQQLTSTKNDVNSALYSLTAGGGTNIATGIYAATTELTSIRANSNAIPFQVLLSDGQSNAGDSAAAANAAAAQGIKIFTIAFGEDADEDELRTIAENTDANYYHATDANVLSDIYALIAKEIQEEATNSNLFVPFFDGALAINLGIGIIQDNNIVFDIGVLEPGQQWTASYTLNFPCNEEYNCNVDAITFPGDGTVFVFTDPDGNTHSFDFNSSITLDFFKRDLKVDIFSGTLYSAGQVYLDVNVSSLGELASPESTLRFYLNDTNTSALLSSTVPALCGSEETAFGCTNNYNIYSPVILNESGIIYATINDDSAVQECPLGNTDAVNCFSVPITQAYVIDYYIWRK
ncbi:MAG: VWA domain-containing protein [Candidatus Diapherotrites archaeon]|nr:VWA domain-containing protein [Candidatus Diapherotrites archaeon]